MVDEKNVEDMLDETKLMNSSKYRNKIAKWAINGSFLRLFQHKRSSNRKKRNMICANQSICACFFLTVMYGFFDKPTHTSSMKWATGPSAGRSYFARYLSRKMCSSKPTLKKKIAYKLTPSSKTQWAIKTSMNTWGRHKPAVLIISTNILWKFLWLQCITFNCFLFLKADQKRSSFVQTS